MPVQGGVRKDVRSGDNARGSKGDSNVRGGN
jgi:hypothetical protein